MVGVLNHFKPCLLQMFCEWRICLAKAKVNGNSPLVGNLAQSLQGGWGVEFI